MVERVYKKKMRWTTLKYLIPPVVLLGAYSLYQGWFLVRSGHPEDDASRGSHKEVHTKSDNASESLKRSAAHKLGRVMPLLEAQVVVAAKGVNSSSDQPAKKILEGSYNEDGEMVGHWSLRRPDGELIHEDILSLIKPEFPEDVTIKWIRPYFTDVNDDGSPDVILWLGGTDHNKKRAVGSIGGRYCEIHFYNLEFRNLGILSVGGNFEHPLAVRISKDLPPLYCFLKNYSGGGEYTWEFWMWDDHQMKMVLSTFLGVSAGDPSFRDVNNDGYQEIIGFMTGVRAPPMIENVYEWDPKLKYFHIARDNANSYWQEQIDRMMLELKRCASGDRSIFRFCRQLGDYFVRRGGAKGVKEYLATVDKRLAPFVANDRNDHLQKRAIEIKRDIYSKVQRLLSLESAP